METFQNKRVDGIRIGMSNSISSGVKKEFLGSKERLLTILDVGSGGFRAKSNDFSSEYYSVGDRISAKIKDIFLPGAIIVRKGADGTLGAQFEKKLDAKTLGELIKQGNGKGENKVYGYSFSQNTIFFSGNNSGECAKEIFNLVQTGMYKAVDITKTTSNISAFYAMLGHIQQKGVKIIYRGNDKNVLYLLKAFEIPFSI